MIIICSSHRAAKQHTWKFIPKSLRGQTKVLVPHDQVRTYSLYLPADNVMGCDEPAQSGIGFKRQWVLENCGPKVIMLDDDMMFARRRTDDPTKFTPSTEQDMLQLFELIYTSLDTYAHVGVAPRSGANRRTEPMMYVGRMICVLAYDTARALQAGARFDRMPLMEDMDVTLTLLKAGLPNLLINSHVQDHKPCNAPGGCSRYRTAQLQAQAADMLAQLHAPFVSVVEKSAKAWGDPKGTRKDVIVQWRKAYSGVLP